MPEELVEFAASPWAMPHWPSRDECSMGRGRTSPFGKLKATLTPFIQEAHSYLDADRELGLPGHEP